MALGDRFAAWVHLIGDAKGVRIVSPCAMRSVTVECTSSQ